MANFKHIFIRASLTEAERRRDFDLRKQARERNQAIGHCNVAVLPPLGGANHASLAFDLFVPIVTTKPVTYLDFANANFDAIPEELSNMDWRSLPDDAPPIDALYHRFAFTMHTLFSRYVPVKQRRHLWTGYPRHIINLFEHRDRAFHFLR
ncbi:hypothetical protein ANCDUO_02254 [Ancylostoma duodenale]|uniref:Uncharacterized protein n=1 Tax=Ancylostoma duodenale TaxID=51022 RepID=A0A0C2HCZ8_9BILA|nr:hypothetical protein ANCDUO_02254 [Ancylostoma duodenale]